jgi:hypothetical protein
MSCLLQISSELSLHILSLFSSHPPDCPLQNNENIVVVQCIQLVFLRLTRKRFHHNDWPQCSPSALYKANFLIINRRTSNLTDDSIMSMPFSYSSKASCVTPTQSFCKDDCARERYCLTFFPEFKDTESSQELAETQCRDVDFGEIVPLDRMSTLEDQEAEYALCEASPIGKRIRRTTRGGAFLSLMRIAKLLVPVRALLSTGHKF